MRKHSTLMAALLVLSLAPPGFAEQGVPVVVGADDQADACGTLGRVSGLDPNGANLLSVRAGPGQSHTRTDLIGVGQPLWICGGAGDWVSIIYGPGPTKCGVSSPISKPQVYDGPCNAGWVHSRYVTPIAG